MNASVSRSRFLRSGLALTGLASMPLALRVARGQGSASSPAMMPPPECPAGHGPGRVPAADRRAILAQAGGHEVRFQFFETLPLRPGYALADAYEEHALEWVEIVVDEPERIELQHLLVIPGGTEDGEERPPMVIKHWAQEWVWQDRLEWAFVGNQRWERREASPEQAAGTWTQRVTQVDDSPRYEGRGRWIHQDGDLSVWEAEPGWRPLPRRDYSKRKDYQVVGCVNRHVVGPMGWVHEQDNTKLVLDAGRALPLVREAGINSYTRLDDDDERFAPARKYWADLGPRWVPVKQAWVEAGQDQSVIAFGFDDHGRALNRALTDLVQDSALAVENLQARAREVIQGFLLV